MKSKELFERAQRVLPGGVSSPVRRFDPYPFFAAGGKGCILESVDGKSYIDYCLAYGPLILGHAHPRVVEAVERQIERGTTYGVPSEGEIELAETIIDRVPCAEMVRFMNSGTEATMAAVRLARAYTGRDKIVKFEGSYHGAHDYVLVKPGSGAAAAPDSPGIPEDTVKNTLTTVFNDEEAMVELIDGMGDEIACILVEPVMGNIGCIEPENGYLNFLRDVTRENDILLIFDEVITGFRLAAGGAQEYYRVKPDLVTLGKIVGGGFPMGALAGPRQIMENIAPAGSVYQAGTFNGNPVSVTAGLETLKILDDKVYSSLERMGSHLRAGLRDLLSDMDLEYQVAGPASMFQIYFTEDEVRNYADAKKSDTELFMKYFQGLLERGVFIPPSQFECCFISAAHEMDHINSTLETAEDVLSHLKN
ncbi:MULTISPECIES: glutamate-1-semialdehyde 2,1-aminomutase [unclassified Methanothermobacter]|uniref:glutamate-1-semialdehyde 2,1-aminomutase n=1 Tax=unclassified Methanothermobacter TaxID=2631116 RepID=UPI0002CCFCA5|nr:MULTISPECIES: glutamate-1-semialdehyde 2,1-aminomutase [unclassified Methanothermobacter]BAM69439.1 glutamate-1-semialdehyde aminotransferase [Methanothermobacter sp. CaT2]